MVNDINASIPKLNPAKISDKPVQVPKINNGPQTKEENFQKILDNAVNGLITENSTEVGLSFSKHAMGRLKERSIQLNMGMLEKLDGAIDKAASKGSKESLIISDEAAFIVNVPKRKIITAMDKAQMLDNVFTNIDSTVIA